MEGSRREETRRRVFPVNEAMVIFGMQVEMFPHLAETVETLSGGSEEVTNAIYGAVADEMSYSPMRDTTPWLIRRSVGAPLDPAVDPSEWRTGFLEQLQAQQGTPEA